MLEMDTGQCTVLFIMLPVLLCFFIYTYWGSRLHFSIDDLIKFTSHILLLEVRNEQWWGNFLICDITDCLNALGILLQDHQILPGSWPPLVPDGTVSSPPWIMWTQRTNHCCRGICYIMLVGRSCWICGSYFSLTSRSMYTLLLLGPHRL